MKTALEKEYRNFPDGKLYISKKGRQIQYYIREEASNPKGVYLSKKNRSTVKKYARKYYIEKILKIVNKEIKILGKFSESYRDFPKQIRDVYSLLPDETKEFLNPIDMTDDEFVKKWNNFSYEPKGIGENENVFITDRGERVRSKSELMIANTLNKMDIPYRYECPLELKNGTVIYPDFTVLNVRTREIYYWEHRGMMDDREYAKYAVKRIKEYEKTGIFIGKSLIITEETLSSPLGSPEIIGIIREYLW